ncbi:hypothetical protein GCM10008171_32990 [Methylopila jiangsuensis]|uniref:Arc-like DNA binding domain-containing protein n=1 Tax=Methylopila jiangsuensis TaxID=586230 RepID=A0A9W6JI38_9HYPH|nr:Arc family DNA-binding protein [Methylopila jiangsuensis]MDR6284567.1 plasmid stability protein [Methylopila jiangsuensis]GLK78045.1 hypothetical protein GCM10008171_32990 [Methylopila jiangsuensis]
MDVVGRGADQFALRFPDGMRNRIKVRAAVNRRSMNAEIILMIETVLGQSTQTTAGNSLQATDPAVAVNPSALQGADVTTYGN